MALTDPAGKSGQIGAVEGQVLPFASPQQIGKVHGSEVYSEANGASRRQGLRGAESLPDMGRRDR